MKKFVPLLSLALLLLFCPALSCCATPAVQRGSVWLSGTGIPELSAGDTGDYYLDFSTGSVYEKTADGWTVRGNLRSELSAEQVKITFDAVGGELPEGYAREMTVTKGECMALPVPYREGYRFLGWFYGAGANGGQANDLTVFSRDVLLTAEWRKLHYLTFTSEQTEAQPGAGAFRFAGSYDGTSPTLTLYLEKEGVRKSVDDAGDWIAQHAFTFDKENGAIKGFVDFIATGNYRLILVAEEDGDRVEAQLSVRVTEA